MQTARIWRDIPQRYRMEAGECQGCGKRFYPPRRLCDGCGGSEFKTVRLPLSGKLSTFTVIHNAQSDFSHFVPMILGIVELDDGTRVMAQVADAAPGEVKTGMRVRLEFRKVKQDGVSGVISYGHKAVPVTPA